MSTGAVVIVEDHLSFAQAVRVVFEGAGIGPVVLARTVADALARAEADRPSLVVTDLELPDQPGERIVEWCISRGVPVVVLSAYARPDASVRWARTGVNGFLHKSVDLDKLIDVCVGARLGRKTFDVDQLLSGLEPARPPQTPIRLSGRETEIFELLATGASTEDISATCYLSQETVRTYIKRALSKLGARSRLEGVARARQLGLLQDVDRTFG